MFKKLAVFLFLAAWSCASFAQTADWATYRTDGHAKSNGVELAIAYPGDWLAQESGGPHIVQQFVSPNRRAYAMILVHDLGPAAGKTRSELSQAISQPEQLKRMVPEGMEVLDARQASIGSVPAAVLEYQGSAQRAGMTVEQRIWTLLFVHGQSMIQLQFAVGGPEGIGTAKLMEEYKPLFARMVDSVVLPGGAREGAEAPADH